MIMRKRGWWVASIEYWFCSRKSHFSVRSSNCSLDLVCSFSTLACIVDQFEQLNLGLLMHSVSESRLSKHETLNRNWTYLIWAHIVVSNCEMVYSSTVGLTMLLSEWVMLNLASRCWFIVKGPSVCILVELELSDTLRMCFLIKIDEDWSEDRWIEEST